MNIFNNFQSHFENKIAVIESNINYSYHDLNSRSNYFQSFLISKGCSSQSRIAVSMETCFNFVAIQFAIFKLNATYIPIDYEYPEERIKDILVEIKPDVILFSGLKRNCFLNYNCFLIENNFSDSIKNISTPENLTFNINNIAYIIFTSGTTGQPKGVQISYKNLMYYIASAKNTFRYTTDDIIPIIAKYSFSITFFEYIVPIMSGATIIITPRKLRLDMKYMYSVLARSTFVHASPSWWAAFINFIETHVNNNQEFNKLRHVSSGGDHVPPDVLLKLKQIFDNAEVFVIYGCSEISCMGTFCDYTNVNQIEKTLVGSSFSNMKVGILSKDNEILEPGKIGEVAFCGEGVSPGYINYPELNDHQFIIINGDRYYKTGDIGKINSENQLELIGRKDFQIKIHGNRIETLEIENRIRLIQGVLQVIVGMTKDNKNSIHLVAYIVKDKVRKLTKSIIINSLSQYLPKYMIPSFYVFLENLPLNVNGKIDRKYLFDNNFDTVLKKTSEKNGHDRLSEIEQMIFNIFEDSLGHSQFSANTNFFEIGGDSISAINVLSQIDKQLNLYLPVSSLMENPTVYLMAKQITSIRNNELNLKASVHLIKEGVGETDIFFIHDGNGEIIPYLNLAQKFDDKYTVYGIIPKSTDCHPILHTRISEIVDYYTQQILNTSTGKVILSGLCIGGFIAFEVARKLKTFNVQVIDVVLIDVAHVLISHKSITHKRVNSVIQSIESTGFSLNQIIHLFFTLVTKLVNTAKYEIKSRYVKFMNKRKFLILRKHCDKQYKLKKIIKGLEVDPVLRYAEKEYVDPGLYDDHITLIRATKFRGVDCNITIDDTPYIDLFDDQLLGWKNRALNLDVFDVEAGHSSMLQEPFVNDTYNYFVKSLL